MTGKGINMELVPTAQDSINAYKQKLTEALNELKSDIDFSTSFIGENQSAAFNNFYSKVLDRVNETFAFLDSFSTTIEQVSTSYASEESAIAEGLNSAEFGSGQ